MNVLKHKDTINFLLPAIGCMEVQIREV